MKKRNQNQNINNNKKKDKASYAKMFKDQVKKESEVNSNKPNIINNKKENNKEKENNQERDNNQEKVKNEIKHNIGINFDNLSDWDNIVYPGDNEIKEILNKDNNNNIQHSIQPIEQDIKNSNNSQHLDRPALYKMDINNNNVINEIQEEENENNNISEQFQQIQQNIKYNNINVNNNNIGINVNNYNNEAPINMFEYQNNNDPLYNYHNGSLGTNNINNNILNNYNNQNLLKDNLSSQIKPIEFRLGVGNDINNNTIKEEDSLEQIENNKENINNDIDIDNSKEQRDIMQQMEEEMNLSMNQMNELAGNIIDTNNNKGNKKKKIYLKNDNSSKGNVKKNAQKTKNNNNIKDNKNNNIIIDVNSNKEISLNNANNNNSQNNYFNSNNFSFKPTNIQQVSSEEVNKFIQNNQQKIDESQKQMNNQIQNVEHHINNNINQNMNMNINTNLPNNIPLYPSNYPMVVGQNTNIPPQIYNMPYNMNSNMNMNMNMNQPMSPVNIYPYPPSNINYPQITINPMVQNQYINNNIMEQQKNDKKKANYKPKSLKEYKEKYNNGVKEHRGGLGANIGGKEWEHKKEQNMKVKKYSEMIKNQNKEKENILKKKLKNFKLKNELNEQLYDSLSDEVLEDIPKKQKEINSENNKEKEKEKRPESNKVRYLMQLKKEKEKEKEKRPKQKYSKYTKIVIESIDKRPLKDKKNGKEDTKAQKRRPSTKDKKQPINIISNNNDNKKRSQSTGFKNHLYKKDDYEDELTKQFMSSNPNEYNGLANNKDISNNFVMHPTVEIENLIQKKNQFDDKIKEIKKFLKK